MGANSWSSTCYKQYIFTVSGSTETLSSASGPRYRTCSASVSSNSLLPLSSRASKGKKIGNPPLPTTNTGEYILIVLSPTFGSVPCSLGAQCVNYCTVCTSVLGWATALYKTRRQTISDGHNMFHRCVHDGNVNVDSQQPARSRACSANAVTPL